MRLTDRIRAHHGLQEADDVGVKASLTDSIRVERKGEGGAREVVAVANTPAVDISQEVVLPEGAARTKDGQIEYFDRARSIYLNHDYDTAPIGTLRSTKLQGKGAEAAWVIRFVLHGKTQASAEIAALFELGEDNPVRGVSIGFIRKDGGEPTDDEKAEYGPLCEYVTREWLWLETSVTPQPCNPEAWIMAVSEGKSIEIADEAARGLERAISRGIVSKSTARLIGLPRRRYIDVPRVIHV